MTKERKSETAGRWEYKMIQQSDDVLSREMMAGWELEFEGHFSYLLKRRVCSICREWQTP